MCVAAHGMSMRAGLDYSWIFIYKLNKIEFKERVSSTLLSYYFYRICALHLIF